MIVRRFGLLLVLGSIIVMAACGGSGGSSGSTVTSVSVSCSPTTVTSGGSSQCTATVSGTGNFSTSVTWSASAGSISTTGLLTAPVVTTSLVDTVTATSVQNTTIAGTAVVTVNPTASGGNVAPLTVDAGPAGLGYVSTNVAFTTVLVCIPNTTTCQTIDHVMVDTGSSGLRLLSAAAGGEFNLSLPPENDSNGNPLGECQVFLDGYVWGTVNTADVVMLGETGVVSSGAGHSSVDQLAGGPEYMLQPESFGRSRQRGRQPERLWRQRLNRCRTVPTRLRRVLRKQLDESNGLLRLSFLRMQSDYGDSGAASAESGNKVSGRQQRSSHRAAFSARRRLTDGERRDDLRHRHAIEQWPGQRTGVQRA